ncbi:MAG: helix-turn-helix domain-containing protein, partial [Stigonema ocellatum SAG 48.90 = DSM 106950]|nr:helix-turn-helix domain-containing protein [Stigonema ocellatum SAG 48.90 = DSM 106950]
MSKVKLSKQEAAEFLGVSPRTVERHAQRGSLHPVYEHGENGKEAFYNLSELEKLQSNLNTQTHTSEVVGGEVTGVDGGEVQSPDAGNSIAQQTSLVLTIREIVFEVLAAVRIKQSPLDSYRELSEAAAQGWILPTSVV